MPKTIDELFRLIRKHLLLLAIAPLAIFGSLFLVRIRTFLIEKILPLTSKETVWLGLLLLLYLFVLSIAYIYSLRKKITDLKPQAEPSTPWKFHEKITLGIGDYYDVLTKHGDKYFKITLKDISKKNMPPPYESDHTPDEIQVDVATVSFDPGYIVPGSRIKQLQKLPFFNEDCFDMSKIENGEEERYSAFLFKTEYIHGGEFFFRCYVDHINPIKKEVELNIYFIWENNPNKSEKETI